jgi:hypothetical protein
MVCYRIDVGRGNSQTVTQRQAEAAFCPTRGPLREESKLTLIWLDLEARQIPLSQGYFLYRCCCREDSRLPGSVVLFGR